MSPVVVPITIIVILLGAAAYTLAAMAPKRRHNREDEPNAISPPPTRVGRGAVRRLDV